MKQKKIALFDIDKTIYNGYTLFLLSEHQLKEKTIKQDCFDKICEDFEMYKRGVINYETTITNLLIHWAKGLKGISYVTVSKQAKHFLEGKGNRFYPFLKPVIELLQETHQIYLVTGEPKFIGQIISDLYQITGFIASEFETKNGIFTGEVKTFLAKREEKKESIKQLLEEHKTEHSFALGDSEGDIEMLNSVENAICISPTEGLRKIAKEKGWIITKPDEVENIFKK
ncbi:HAD family hydrolase [Patescibacteria group bacterium]